MKSVDWRRRVVESGVRSEAEKRNFWGGLTQVPLDSELALTNRAPALLA